MLSLSEKPWKIKLEGKTKLKCQVAWQWCTLSRSTVWLCVWILAGSNVWSNDGHTFFRIWISLMQMSFVICCIFVSDFFTASLFPDYSCALQRDILLQGRLYLSENWICFYSNIFRWETLVRTLTLRKSVLSRVLFILAVLWHNWNYNVCVIIVCACV